jgi:E3 ubiquitin-protein ligase DOA10
LEEREQRKRIAEQGKKRKNNSNEQQFQEELIRPCLCDSVWHRTCIREMIIKTELIECPICHYQYTIGYTDCVAIANKKRPNYLKYMLA